MITATFPTTSSLAARFDAQRLRLSQWAFAAAVRLSDQNRPIALKLIIECMIVVRAVAQWLRATPATTARRVRRTAASASALRRQPRRGAYALPQRRPQPVPTRQAMRAPRLPPGVRRCVRQKSAFLCMLGLRG